MATASLPQDPDLDQLRKQARSCSAPSAAASRPRSPGWHGGIPDRAGARHVPVDGGPAGPGARARLRQLGPDAPLRPSRDRRRLDSRSAGAGRRVAGRPVPPAGVPDLQRRRASRPGGRRTAAGRAPRAARADLFVAAACADVPEVRRHLAGRQAAASVTGGPHGWSPMLYQAYARHDPQRRPGGHAGDGPAAARRRRRPQRRPVLARPAHPVHRAHRRARLRRAAVSPGIRTPSPRPAAAGGGRRSQRRADPVQPHVRHRATTISCCCSSTASAAIPAARGTGCSASRSSRPREMLRSLLAWAVAHDQRRRVALLAEHGVDIVSPFTEERSPRRYTPVEVRARQRPPRARRPAPRPRRPAAAAQRDRHLRRGRPRRRRRRGTGKHQADVIAAVRRKADRAGHLGRGPGRAERRRAARRRGLRRQRARPQRHPQQRALAHRAARRRGERRPWPRANAPGAGCRPEYPRQALPIDPARLGQVLRAARPGRTARTDNP